MALAHNTLLPDFSYICEMRKGNEPLSRVSITLQLPSTGLSASQKMGDAPDLFQQDYLQSQTKC